MVESIIWTRTWQQESSGRAKHIYTSVSSYCYWNSYLGSALQKPDIFFFFLFELQSFDSFLIINTAIYTQVRHSQNASTQTPDLNPSNSSVLCYSSTNYK